MVGSTSTRKRVRSVMAALAVPGLLAGAAACTNSGGRGGAPSYTMVFRSGRSGNDEIWRVAVTGTVTSNLQQLTSTPVSEFSPALSHDRTKVAFVRSGQGIWVKSVDGTGSEVQVTTEANDFEPAWSPDGTKIAFQRHVGPYDIWVVPVGPGGATGPAVNLTNDAASDSTVAWSPDGTKLAYDTSNGGNSDVWVMDSATGGNRVNVSSDPGNVWNEYGPDWSPNGAKVVFSSSRAGSDQLYTVSPNGSGIARIPGATPAVGIQGLEPRYSPDGKTLAFYNNGVIELVPVAGGAPTQILVDPAWSDDPDW